MTTFTWTPDFGGNKQAKPNVSQVKYGDGYEQRYAIGINSMVRNFNLVFGNRDQTERNAIIAFLEARAAVEAFLWTPPGESTALVFVCRQWTEQLNKGNWFTVSASFEQVFEP